MMVHHADVGRMARGEQTRAQILEAALELFRAQRYEATTMRAVAERAGVALGNAYYYFASDEQLIQAFYARTHDEHLLASRRILERERDLKARLLGVMRAKIESIEPYHRFAGLLFRSAADPRSPLHPLSEASADVRAASTALFAEVVQGSNLEVPKDLAADLPRLLWLYHMGIVLFWIHDSSPARARTHKLIDHSVDRVVRLIRLGGTAILRPLRKRALRMLADIEHG